MRLRVFTPAEIVLETEVSKIVAIGPNGSFGLLPRHIDFVTALVPGVMAYVDMEESDNYIGIDEGILVKRSGDVQVSTRKAVRGTDLDDLRSVVRHDILEIEEHERAARSALARLEAGVIRRFMELRER